jgi:hypothetical protein
MNNESVIIKASFVLFVVAVPLIVENPVKFTARNSNPGSLGIVSENDLKVITKIENIYKNSEVNDSYDRYKNSPKILIFPLVITMGNEKWLFPNNAETILPLHNVFPVAFFYTITSDQYKQDNYLNRISNGLDYNWLKKSNIRYAFISDNEIIPDNIKESLSSESSILFSSGNASFIRFNF